MAGVHVRPGGVAGVGSIPVGVRDAVGTRGWWSLHKVLHSWEEHLRITAKEKIIPLANFYSQYYHCQEISFLPGGRKENSTDGQLIFICS